MTPPTEAAVLEAVGKLTKAQRALIPHMSDGGFVYPLPRIAETVPLLIAEARKAVRGLREMGLVVSGPLYDEDDGRLKGSGTWLNAFGLAVRQHLEASLNERMEP